jgi:hypothetical protein
MIYEPIQVYEGNGIDPEILEALPEFSHTISIDGDLGTPCNFIGYSDNYLEISHRDGYLEKLFADNRKEVQSPLSISGNKPFKFKATISNVGWFYGCFVTQISPTVSSLSSLPNYKVLIAFDGLRKLR